jgi:catechol 2,3-dioxygenase-like lactoylglutathione lyase family enzyme
MKLSNHTLFVNSLLEQTQKFYEDILGWQRVAVWRECDKVFGEDELHYCHLFFPDRRRGSIGCFPFRQSQAERKIC